MVLVLVGPLVYRDDVLYHSVGLARLPFRYKQDWSYEFRNLVRLYGGDDALLEEFIEVTVEPGFFLGAEFHRFRGNRGLIPHLETVLVPFLVYKPYAKLRGCQSVLPWQESLPERLLGGVTRCFTELNITKDLVTSMELLRC